MRRADCGEKISGHLVRAPSLWAMGLTLAFVGCSRGGGGKDDPPPSAPPLPSSGVEVQVDPFSSKDNVSLAVAAGSGAFVFGAPVTIPGVHWAWTTALPKSVLWDRGDGKWNTGSFEQGMVLPEPPFRLHYTAKLSDAASKGYPVVGGRAFSDQGALMASSFLFALPKEHDVPVRVRLSVRSAAGSAEGCGEGCFAFPGYWQALETPLSFSRASVWTLGASDGLPWEVAFDSSLEDAKAALGTGVATARERFGEAWNALSERWGTSAAGMGYRVHVMVDGGCSAQGLEHDASTLLAIGYCQGQEFVDRLVRLAVHEGIHVWNGKLVHPEATSSWPFLSFYSARLPLVYYYEGFTEGYARILLGELFPEMREGLRKRWNGSLASLKGMGESDSLEKISSVSPGAAYDVGAVLALRMGAALRAAFGLSEARRLFWGMHRDLAERGGFALEKFLWQQRCFSGVGFVPCVGQPVGYTREMLLGVFEKALGAGWPGIRDAHFVSGFLPAPTALAQLVRALAEATGSTASEDGSGIRALSVDSWPL